jgi:hypothetical protein
VLKKIWIAVTFLSLTGSLAQALERGGGAMGGSGLDGSGKTVPKQSGSKKDGGALAGPSYQQIFCQKHPGNPRCK